MDRIAEPRRLLVGGLLLAGVALLGWLVWQQVRRQGSAPSIQETRLPLGRPRFAGEGPAGESVMDLPNDGDEVVSQAQPISTSPQAPVGDICESVRPLAPLPILPNEPDEPTAESSAQRDEEEISSAAAPALPPPAEANAAKAVSATSDSVAEPLDEESDGTKEVVEESEEIAARPELISPAVFAMEERVPLRGELVVQGQPIPQPTPFAPSKPFMTELTELGDKFVTAPTKIEPATATIAAIAGSHTARQSPVETPSFASKIITAQLITPPATTPVIMPATSPTSVNEPRPATPVSAKPDSRSASVASAPTSDAMQTAVQLTFALEIASLQLTPTFKMSSLQVKPISKIVAMRLAPSSQPQPAMNLQVTFELSSVQLGTGASLDTVRLTPSSAQRPTPVTSPSFEISGLQLLSGSAAAPVQLTPVHQGQASVLMTA